MVSNLGEIGYMYTSLLLNKLQTTWTNAKIILSS